MIGDDSYERDGEHRRKPGDHGGPAEVVAPGEVPDGQGDPSGEEGDREQVAPQAEDDLPDAGGGHRDAVHEDLLSWELG